jgi:hypothetical protein
VTAAVTGMNAGFRYWVSASKTCFGQYISFRVPRGF